MQRSRGRKNHCKAESHKAPLQRPCLIAPASTAKGFFAPQPLNKHLNNLFPAIAQSFKRSSKRENRFGSRSDFICLYVTSLPHLYAWQMNKRWFTVHFARAQSFLQSKQNSSLHPEIMKTTLLASLTVRIYVEEVHMKAVQGKNNDTTYLRNHYWGVQKMPPPSQLLKPTLKA